MLNPKKSKCIVISRNVLDLAYFPSLFIGGAPIEFVDTAKNLGVIFNRTLTWDDHINCTVGKVYGTLRMLWATHHFIPSFTRKMLAKTLVVPMLIYGCEIYCDGDAVSKRKLNVAFNNTVRYIYGLRRYDHISGYAESLYNMPFNKLLQYRALVLLFNVIQSHQPGYLYDRLRFSISNRTNVIINPTFSCRTSERQFFFPYRPLVEFFTKSGEKFSLYL